MNARLPASVLATTVLAAGLLVGVGPVGAADGGAGDSSVSVVRFEGADRYETSLRAAEAVAVDAGGSLEWVVMVSGERWTDAVVAAPLAGRLGAAVLMTPPGELRADAAEFLGRVGIERVLVVGPAGVGGGVHGIGRGVGSGTVAALRDAGMSVDRVAGDDVYGTAVAAARRMGEAGTLGNLGRTVVLASGKVFADALVAGPFAARGGHPVLLTPPDRLHLAVSGFLGETGVDTVVVMGGPAAVSQQVRNDISALGIEIEPVSGETRFETAVKAAELVDGEYSDAAGRPCFSSATVGVARARVPFDSFSAAPLLARLCAPLLLAEPALVPAETAGYIDAAREAHSAVRLRVFGGDAAVSQAAIDAYLNPDSAPGEVPVGLPPGTCGGEATDLPTRLVDHAESEDPAWSPDCTRIVYSRSGDIWTANLDGSDARRIISVDGAFLDEPAWSPDGARIAYSSGGSNSDGYWVSHIWTADAAGAGREKLTSGDVRDGNPAWSPHGGRIAFERLSGEGRDDDGNRIDADRYIAVMNADGSDARALTAGGRSDYSPVWSPDGARIAYVGGGAARVMQADGSHDRTLTSRAWWNGGLAWSPDGSRVAFARGSDSSGTDIVAVEVNGFGDEFQITDVGGWAVEPKWSPDGQRIAFTHYDQIGAERAVNGTRYASAVGAAGMPVPNPARQCKPRGVSSGTTAGFPLPSQAAPSVGTVRVAVLFVDFPDAQAAYSTHEEARNGMPWAEEYLEAMSYGKLDVQYVAHHEWLRAPRSYRDYLAESVTGRLAVRGEIYQDAVDLVDDEFDFSGFHSLAVILPSPHFSAGSAGGSIDADGVSLRKHINNDTPKDEPGETREWGPTAAHELAHNLGVPDYYPYDRSVHDLPDPGSDWVWAVVDWGLLHLDSHFRTGQHDARLRLDWTYPSGSTATSQATYLAPEEMLAWSRWLLGWLDETQVRCVAEPATTVSLAPIARPSSGTAMAAVPLSRREVIVVESRRKLGYDRGREYRGSNGGRTTLPGLVEEGVLVYTVDASLGSGDLPLKVAGDSGNGQVDDFPVLQAGESVTVRGYTITVTADNGDTHTVTISRDDS